MITLAFDTATDRCTVAATNGVQIAHRAVDGARQHARAILTLIGQVLDDVGGVAAGVDRVISADGPGSFTGLRVSAAVAKALVWHRDVEWWVTPSLLGRAWHYAPAGGGTVLALSDALRGELYAGAWRVSADEVTPIQGPPRAMLPEALIEFGVVDRVIGSIPSTLLARVIASSGSFADDAGGGLPDARALLALIGVRGGATRVAVPAEWSPDYGRPAEAQAVWERTHGVALPVTPGITR